MIDTQKPARRPHKVLVLEDVDADAELLGRRLRKTGLSLELRRVINKAACLDGLESLEGEDKKSDTAAESRKWRVA
jgi:hypothetical protein